MHTNLASNSAPAVLEAIASPALPLLAAAQALADQLVAVAQREYDDWDESDVDKFSGGGICHLIAEKLVGVFDRAGIEASYVWSCHEQHAYVACQLAEGVITLDVPHRLYKRGAGFTWTKLPNVVFSAADLAWYCVDANPAAYSAYIED